MSRSRARCFHLLGFLGLCILIESGIEWTGLRAESLSAAEDSISLATGLASPLVEALLVGAFAWICLRIFGVVSGSLRSVAGETKREVRPSTASPHEHADGGDTESEF